MPTEVGAVKLLVYTPGDSRDSARRERLCRNDRRGSHPDLWPGAGNLKRSAGFNRHPMISKHPAGISLGFFDTASFLAQQGGDKALKSLLYYHGSRQRGLLTHSRVEMKAKLRKPCEWITGLAGRSSEVGSPLRSIQVSERYSSGYPHRFYGKETAEQALQAAQKIVGAVTQHYRSEGDEDILREEDGE